MSIFPQFIEKYGHSTDSVPVPDEIFNKYKDRLSRNIIEFWKEEGFGGFANGLVWTINPDDYIGYVPQYLEIRANGIPFMRTAFGDLIIATRTRKGDQILIIDIKKQRLGAIADNVKDAMEKSFCLYEYFIHVVKAEKFQKAFETLGSLKSYECYAYEPLLSLGGKEDINNLKIVKIEKYIDLATKTLKGYVD